MAAAGMMVVVVVTVAACRRQEANMCSCCDQLPGHVYDDDRSKYSSRACVSSAVAAVTLCDEQLESACTVIGQHQKLADTRPVTKKKSLETHDGGCYTGVSMRHAWHSRVGVSGG